MISLLYRLADAARRRARGDADGRSGEDLAHRHLRRHGCTVVARNYRPRQGGGELDLVAWDGAALAVVEVKTRANADFGDPDRAVDEEKRHYLRRAAHDYARRAGVDPDKLRFDVVTVVLARPPRIEWRRDAFR